MQTVERRPRKLYGISFEESVSSFTAYVWRLKLRGLMACSSLQTVLTVREKVSIAWYWQDPLYPLRNFGTGFKIRQAEDDLLRHKKEGHDSKGWFNKNNIPLLNTADVELRLRTLHYSFAAITLRNEIRIECDE